MKLQLKRPMVVRDLESTGLNPRYDRIIEVGAVKIHPDGRRESYEQRVNPERPIPAAAVAVHGIRQEDLAGEPTFRDIAGALGRFLRGADLAGFGIRQFDLPLLQSEFARVGIEIDPSTYRIVDAKTIFHKREPRTLEAALHFYCSDAHPEAHSAMGDALATAAVLEGQLERYPDLPQNIEALDALCYPRDPDAVDPDGKLRWSDDEVIIDFGQKRGQSLRELAMHEPSYLRWILNKDFSEDVKRVIGLALEGKFLTRRPTADTGTLAR